MMRLEVHDSALMTWLTALPLLLLLLVAAGAGEAAAQRRLFGQERDVPRQSWRIEGFNDSVAQRLISELPAGELCGIWQATGDGARVALVSGDAPGAWRATSGEYDGVPGLLMVILDSPRPAILPGTVTGWCTPAATPGLYEAYIFTRAEGRELTVPKRFTLKAADGSHLVLTPAAEGFRVQLWKLLPYFFRSSLREAKATDGMDGLLRLWPRAADSPPVTPVVL